jgi:hypothetical protein
MLTGVRLLPFAASSASYTPHQLLTASAVQGGPGIRTSKYPAPKKKQPLWHKASRSLSSFVGLIPPLPKWSFLAAKHCFECKCGSSSGVHTREPHWLFLSGRMMNDFTVFFPVLL